ncbi:hypothetical protein ACEN4F_09040 [Ruoffia sp. FAM 20858]
MSLILMKQNIESIRTNKLEYIWTYWQLPSGTDAAYLFYNSDGGISLALPDLKNELQNVDQKTWIEYQMVR